jgi:acetoin utilization deacetylase AcuC-like enzyme
LGPLVKSLRMKIFLSDHVTLPLPQGHRFPAEKYSRLRQRVIEACLVPPQNLIVCEPATLEQLLRVHTPDYVQRVLQGLLTEKEVRRTGFPWSQGLVERSLRSVGGTIAACRAALDEGIAVNLAGGTHHAFPDHGEGYCVFNDVAVAARAMQAENRAIQIVFIDLDVHQGNGSAAIFAGDDRVFTFSVHGAKNFPFHKEIGSLDIALPDKTGDDQFLEAVSQGTRTALERAHASLAIYLAGADPFVGDTLGRMAVSKEGLAERDRIVFDLCTQYGLPVAVVMAGGYARNIEDTVDIQFNTVRIAAEMRGE